MLEASSVDPTVSVIILAYRQVERLESVLQELREHDSASSFEVIVVANNVTAEVGAVLDRNQWCRRLDCRVNRGFGGGCNHGAGNARGEFLVFLNDDASIREGWLDALVSVMVRHEEVAALASVLVDANDVVLEAGGAVNHRGDVWPPDRGRSLRSIQGRGPRRVGYATAGSLIVRKSVFNAVGGFDLDYHPAYFEDADLSCRIWQAGHEVWTTTASVVEHAESASSSGAVKRALQLRNGAIFRGRWTSAFHRGGVPALELGDELPLPDSSRVLFIDDRVPSHGVGSGAGRARQNILAIARAGNDVLLHPREPADALDSELTMAGVELVTDLSAVVPGSVSAVVISRPHNHVLWDDLRVEHPDAMFVYDAEARFSARIERQLELDVTEEDRVRLESDLEEMLELERTIVNKADAVVTISTDEKPWFESAGNAMVYWVDPLPDSIDTSESFERDRHRAVFVAGWEAGPDSPNGDAVRWLAGEVLPLVRAAGIRVTVEVTGRGVPDSIKELECDELRFVGNVPDLSELHRSARLALAPTRYGAGVKLKVLDALCSATPVVATSVGAEGIASNWRDHITVVDDPAAFAAAMVQLLDDDERWTAVHEGLQSSASGHRADASGSWSVILGAQERALEHADDHG